MKKIILTENGYLILFFGSILFVSIVFLVLGLIGKMEYSLAIGLFTSFFTTGITIFFLNIILNYRQEVAWKKVRSTVHSMISEQSSILFFDIIDLTEESSMVNGFIHEVTMNNDESERKQLIKNKMNEINKDTSIKINPKVLKSEIALFMKDLSEIRGNINQIQLAYGNQVKNSEIIQQLINLDETLKLIDISNKIFLEIEKNQNDNQPFYSLFAPTTAFLISLKSLVKIISELWDSGINFSYMSHTVGKMLYLYNEATK
jgi:hypothetical protein